MRMIIVSGLSGSGKTIALQTLEDLDCYCVDNLPFNLIGPLVQEILAASAKLPPTVAVGVDARNFFDELSRFPAALTELRASGLTVEVLFLQAADEILLKRYSETRRRHPLDLGSLPLREAIRQERHLLEPIVASADLIIDTSNTNLYQLRELIRARVHDTPGGAMSLLFESFGFKNGVPVDADFVFDVRCLPNPHWEAQLRPLTGLDQPVIDFLERQPEVAAMIADLRQFLASWLPKFALSDRSYLTVAIGCTGGQHRSVFIAEALARSFNDIRQHVMVRHRELK
ncbi:MAG TPA: RNase adapter RapZ [Candidatus Competibacteraceae bacterium]|nr:MAG: RNase adapter RapZ [Candidatus Competibacteraceae bacterium]HOB60526.1 RNase adapter RapZ [Candidatus Competibacteraceae bacterium]HQA24648.1 RNase adapter RapZ [Candidatus Competibacteraceae bacterium]HQD54897.1 RNase adapter RapZ [Candidatus Competibacteraceae bacterium]